MRISGLAISIATLMTFGGYAQAQTPAQTGELSADHVKSFFAQVQQEVTQLVQRKDNQAIMQWQDRNVADSAHFKIAIEMTHQNQPKMWSVIDLDKADIQRMRPMMGGEAMLRSLQDYSLQIQVNKVTPHGPDAATAMVTWTDTAKIMPPAMATSGQAQSTVGQATQSGQTGTQSGGQMMDVKRSFSCEQLLVREQSQLKIGLSTCTGRVQF